MDREPVFKNVLAHSYPPINTYIMSFCLFWKFCKWYLPIHVLLRYFTFFFCLMCFWSVSRLIYALIYEKWKFIHNCSAVVCYSVIYSFCVIFYCMITTLYIYPFSTLGIHSGFRVFWLRLLQSVHQWTFLQKSVWAREWDFLWGYTTDISNMRKSG